MGQGRDIGEAMSDSEWYLKDAMRLLEQALTRSGRPRRDSISLAIRQLIAYLIGRSPPPQNAIACADEPRCDKCFIHHHKDMDVELCRKCALKATGKKMVKNGNHGLKETNARQEHPEHKGRIKKHRARVRKDLKRLGLGE